MHAITGASTYGTLTARDGTNYAALAVLAGVFPGVQFVENPFMAWGPGVTADVPGTRLYWLNPIFGVGASSGSVWWTNGAVVTNMNFDPANGVGMGQMFAILYDPATERLYVAYSANLPEAGACGVQVYRFYVSYWDGAVWTDLPLTRAIGTACACMSLIPATALANPGDLIVGWSQDCAATTTNRIQRYTGGVWVNERATTQTRESIFLAPWGDSVVAGFQDTTAFPSPQSLVHLRDTAGVWTDITPASWADPTMAGTTPRAVCAAEYQGDLYVCIMTAAGGRREIWKRAAADGTWTLDLDLTVELPPDGYVLSMTVIDGVLRCGMDINFIGNYYLTKTGAVWAQNPLPENLQPPFVESSIQFFLESPEGTITPDEGNCSGEYSPLVAIIGFWDGTAFIAWDPATTWSETRGLWNYIAPGGGTGTYAWIGAGVPLDATPTPVGSGAVLNAYLLGEIDVVDPYILTGYPPNGKGLANVVVAKIAPWASYVPSDFLLGLSDVYEFVCPAIDTVDPPDATIDGGGTITLHGTNFFSNQITPVLPANQVRVVNRIWVRSGSGTPADPYYLDEVDPYTITFVDEETITFPCPPFPGGANPDVELLFQPAGLSPFGFAAPVGIFPTYRCPRLTEPFTYTGVDFAILGSLETVLGLGGTGGDVSATARGAGELGGHPACPPEITPGPCIRP